MGLPSASKAVVQTGVGRFELHEFEVPKVGPDDGILRMELCGICGSDIEQYDGRFDDIGWTKGPTIPGHEPLGIVAAIGERAAARWGVAVGDRVAVEPLIPCGECEACREGLRTRCSGWGRMYSYGLLDLGIEPQILGGYSEYMYLHPNTVLHKMPLDMPASVAVLFNPLAAGVRWATTTPDLQLGDTIVILGAGQRGIACVIAARAAGAGKIIVTDLARAASKLEFARELGADATIVADEEDVVARVHDLTGGRGADIVVDVTPTATQPVIDAVGFVRNGGTIVLSGVKGGPKVELDTDEVVRKSITLRGVFTVDSPAYRRAIRLLESGDRPYERIHTASYSLERAEEAIHHLAGRLDGPPAINVAIAPHKKEG
ncbi:MAG: alcohol dehydrogenase catalytic domain-containing protein [Actinobacteria bacterium]|nr:alcohol dehydrogenase catalytic domain-containing protein [Actinomycetota bacterium]